MLRRAFRQPEDLTKLVYLMQLGRSGPAMLGTRIRGYVLSLLALAPLALGMLFNAPELLVMPAVVLNVLLRVIGDGYDAANNVMEVLTLPGNNTIKSAADLQGKTVYTPPAQAMA